MKRSFLALLIGLATLAAAASAQDTGGAAQPEGRKGTEFKGRAPLAREILRVRLPRPREYALPNGVRVFVLEDHRLPTVDMSLMVRAGGLFEPKPGVADLTASMLDEGTKSRTALELATATESLGASLSASAGAERATLSASGLSESTDRLVDLMADVLLHPAFPQERLQRVKFQTTSNLMQQRTNPAFLASELEDRILYGDTPYGKAAPTAEEIAAVTREDLAAFHERFYRPNGAILGIAGDVDGERVVERLRAALAGWAPAKEAAALPQAAFKPQAATRIYLIDRPNSVQTVLRFGNLAISRTDPDYVPLTVANRVLGGSASSRLFLNLREDKGYTYGASSGLSTPRWPGAWTAGANVRTPVTEASVAEFFREFQRLQKEPVPQDELDRAKRSIIGSFARTLESPAGVLNRTLELVVNGLPLDYWDTFPARVEAVTPAEVERVARKYLGEGRIQLIAVGERGKIEAGLRKYGPLTLYDASGKEIAAP